MKNSIRPHLLHALPLLLVAAGCGSPKPASLPTDATPAGETASASPSATPSGDGLALLKQSMDRYKSLKSFSAKCGWKMDAGPGMGGVTSAKREIYFEAPNKFHAISTTVGGFRQDSVSDGLTTVEWSNARPNETNVIKYDAPASIDKASSMQMLHPMFCGTLLYQFFAGSNSVESVVDPAKGPITKGKPVQVSGEQAIPVSFYAVRQFGHTKVLIGEKTGKVYEISYDAEPLVEMMKKAKAGQASQIKALMTTESYSNIAFDPEIPKAQLVAKVPSGAKVVSAPKPDDQPGGPKVGTVAPEFTVTPVAGGGDVKLSSLKGQWVLLDFWATWCPPCREGLPHTEAIFKDFKDKNLKVLAISDEDVDTIKPFWDKNGYAMPAFRDADHKAFQAYGANAIPEMVLIDPQGKVAYSQVGLTPEDDLRQNLAKAGLK